MTDRGCLLAVCGAPLTVRAADVAQALEPAGWVVRPVATPSSEPWLGGVPLAEVTGVPVRSTYRVPGQSVDRGLPNAAVVCPATFNTVGKLAAGVADTYAVSAISEVLGAGVSTLVVPMVNERLWGHPAWQRNLDVLAGHGVAFLDPHTGAPEPVAVKSGTRDAVVAGFAPQWIVNALEVLSFSSARPVAGSGASWARLGTSTNVGR